MTNYQDIPELLEDYMAGSNGSGQWITTNGFRTHFNLDASMTSTISGFFRRISLGPYFSCPYVVVRIEKTVEYTPRPHPVKRYYIRRRSLPMRSRTAGDLSGCPVSRFRIPV
jgi:hypothetical protein